MKKTNVMRILDKEKIEYQAISYEIKDNLIDGKSVAKKIGKSQDEVFKTLVSKGHSGEFYVCVIPVSQELSFKKVAKEVVEKKVEMIPAKDLQKVTGYIKGGCSPIGMTKQYTTLIDASASQFEKIIVSAGKIGFQVEIKVEDLLSVTGGKLCHLI